jgi:hypothetical protein
VDTGILPIDVVDDIAASGDGDEVADGIICIGKVSAAGFCNCFQPIQIIVGEGLCFPVGSVSNPGNIADFVIGVGQILERPCLNAMQPEISRVVGVIRRKAIGKLFSLFCPGHCSQCC